MWTHPFFWKLYPFGVRFQHKTKQIPRNVDRFGHRNQTKPVPFLGWFHGIVPILRPCSKSWARILQHFQIYTCTFFVAMPSQSPSLPFDSVQACLHGRECVDFGQQTSMWFYTYSSMLCPQRVNPLCTILSTPPPCVRVTMNLTLNASNA